jgi:hypothetical protein
VEVVVDFVGCYKENGEPSFVSCYEQDDGSVLDRFMVVYEEAERWGGLSYRGQVSYVTMSEHPGWPDGVGCHGVLFESIFKPAGHPVPFSSLPPDCRELVMGDYAELWGPGKEVG